MFCDGSASEADEAAGHVYCVKMNRIRDLALQSLSQEAVRDEAVREIIDELAAIADACVDLQQNRKRPDSDPVMGWDNAPLTLGTLRKARALKREPNAFDPATQCRVGECECFEICAKADACTAKREPNAAGQDRSTERASGERTSAGTSPSPAPAAPDVASMVKRLRTVAEMREPRTAHIIKIAKEAAALLVRLGQGWIPVKNRSADYPAAKHLGEWDIIEREREDGKIFRFTLPPLPGASDD